MSEKTVIVTRLDGSRVPVKVPAGPYFWCDLEALNGEATYWRHLVIRAPDRKAAHARARQEQKAGELLLPRETREITDVGEVAVLVLNGWDVLNV